MTVHVVGMGLAGSWMTWELLQRGMNVTTSDHYVHNSSSRIAAGLINPVTGVPPKENWNGIEILSHAHNAYLHLEHMLSVKVWHDHLVRRVFAHAKDNVDWQVAAAKGLHTSWKQMAPGGYDGVGFPFGGVEYSGATVDTQTFLNAVAQHSKDVRHTTQSQEAPALTIWCEGWRATQNERWKWLPFEPVKGEILDACIEAPFIHAVHIGACWIVPIAVHDETRKQKIRIGSTYDWNDLTSDATEEAKAKLISRASEILQRPIEVVGHLAAVRPAARSKRPYLGRHPNHEKHAILNGLGAKGAMWAPWAAHHLAAHLFDGKELMSEVDIQRWWSE